MLFNTLSEVSLNEDKDGIAWRWTRSGEYTVASANETQFLGAFLAFKATSIWRAKVEPKCRFFAWLAIQGKAPTTDNLMKKIGTAIQIALCATACLKLMTICSLNVISHKRHRIN
jgi:hypothetical protein